MKALILAAGQGDRLQHLTENLPKALVKVGALELLRYQLSFLNHPRIQKIGLVTGYQSSHLFDFIKSNGLSVELFENTQFSQGSILSLKAALPFLDDDFLLLNTDHIYPKRLLDLVLKQVDGITAVCDFDRPLVHDDMKVKLDSNRHLAEIHKELKNYDGGYIGLTLCPKSKLVAYQNYLETTLAKLGPKVSVEMILGEMVKNGEQVHIADTSGVRWLEVDTLEDLKKAEATLKNNPKFLE